MSSSSTPVYMVTGANRGIGLALVKELLARHSDVAVFAGVRDPDAAIALKELQATHSGKLHLLRYHVGDVASNQAAAKVIQDKYGRLDTVIANAAIASVVKPLLETPPEAMNEHYAVNATGLVVLFQAVHTLLRASTSPKFIGISSGAGSLTAYINIPGYVTYGSSKAAANYVMRRLHFEHDWLTAFPLSPGIIDTDMFQSHTVKTEIMTGTIRDFGTALVRPEVGASMLITIIDNATRKGEGGEFVEIDGSRIPW